MTEPTPLLQERKALSHILTRLMREVTDLETLCKHAPRIVSTATNAARVQAALEASSTPDQLATIITALEQIEEEEETVW